MNLNIYKLSHTHTKMDRGERTQKGRDEVKNIWRCTKCGTEILSKVFENKHCYKCEGVMIIVGTEKRK